MARRWTTRSMACSACLALVSAAVGQGVPVTLQWFETSWQTIEDRTADAFIAGYGQVWTPPPSKAEGGTSNVGYAVFDRFDLGSPSGPTRYGTRAGFEAVVAEQNKAAIGTFIDLILNHNGFSSKDTPGFEATGDYPGFVVSGGPEGHGDFHAPGASCNSSPTTCWISNLADIGQEFNIAYIRHPVTSGDPQNIPAGTAYDRPSPNNRQFYSDNDLPANSIGIHPFNTSNPMAGDPVAENATGLLLRYCRWLIEVVGVDGFRIDACKHTPDWFWRDFYDRHVWLRGKPDLSGAPTTPLSFGESILGNPEIAAFVCKGTTGNCNTSGGVTGNRDALDFPLYYAIHDMLSQNGFGNWSSVVNASFDGYFDGNANNGDFGVTFVENHDAGQPLPSPGLLAYAYLLTRAGLPIVYYQAGEFGSVSFPRPSRSDPLGNDDSYLTTLVDVHNEYARGSYLERWIDGDVLIYERDNACLVGLNDRHDNGYDQRTVQTSFTAGTRLKELTGNATDVAVDPTNAIWDVITVDAGGQATIRVPRNRNVNGDWHGRGYVVYGPVNPDGDLFVTPVAETIPADSPSKPNGTRRLTPIDVITADQFEVRLETVDADPLDPAEDDLALLRMDMGMDINGNGYIDSLDPGFVGYGYEHFLTESVSLESGGVDIGGVQKGLYRQIIDATSLSEGRHYLGVIAFRSRPAGSPPIFETWRKVILIDRLAPTMTLADPPPGTPITSSMYQIAVRSPDRTATRVHLFLDQQPGTDVVALAEAGQGLATQTDRDTFARTFTGMNEGHHRLDVVAYEPTRAEPGVTTITGILVQINGFDGLGDMNNDNRTNNRDIFSFVQMAGAGNQFSPAGDMNGNGLVDQDDVPLFADRMYGAGLPQGPGHEATASGGSQISTGQSFFWLQEEAAFSRLGSVTNPDVQLVAGRSVPLYLWFNKATAPLGFDGISFDVRLRSDDGGSAQASISIDEPPGRWYGATAGTTRTDTGGQGIDDANAFDLSNTDTLPDNPSRFATLSLTGVTPGTVKVFLCVGGLGIADSGDGAVVWLGFNNGQTTPENTNIGGNVFGLCSSVPEATIHVSAPVPGDFDFDTDVDQEDFGHLQECLNGSTVPQTEPRCNDASLDGDEFVDEADMRVFLSCLSGAGVPGNPDCAG
ncbi:MAG TPA: hypothetical protein PLL20_05290 [Phycisphaerae bacterium]|nr:hypothetical protein [Phycisphaerae bacterium]HRR83615.1 hypothetical protein [Phycisphaerae bacterium]